MVIVQLGSVRTVFKGESEKSELSAALYITSFSLTRKLFFFLVF